MTLEPCVFVNCRFERCHIADTTLHPTHLNGCRFIGTLRDVKFKSGPLQADLSQARLDGVVFDGTDLRPTPAPKARHHYRVDNFPARCTQALQTLAADTSAYSPELQKIIPRRLRALQNLPTVFFNTKFIRQIEGTDFADAFFSLLKIPLDNE